MSDFQTPRDRWNDMIVPAAKGLEVFFWRLAWFTVFVAFVFAPQWSRMFIQERKPNDQAQPAATSGATDVSDLRPTAPSRN